MQSAEMEFSRLKAWFKVREGSTEVNFIGKLDINHNGKNIKGI